MLNSPKVFTLLHQHYWVSKVWYPAFPVQKLAVEDWFLLVIFLTLSPAAKQESPYFDLFFFFNV